jgi:hypothetical protein
MACCCGTLLNTDQLQNKPEMVVFIWIDPTDYE